MATIMWGNDYPHDEGTWPHSHAALQAAYAGLPRDDIAAMVGGNAARTYGFDTTALAKTAATIGPPVDAVAQPLDTPPAGATSSAFHQTTASAPW